MHNLYTTRFENVCPFISCNVCDFKIYFWHYKVVLTDPSKSRKAGLEKFSACLEPTVVSFKGQFPRNAWIEPNEILHTVRRDISVCQFVCSV